jgi:hypothetical protein
MTRTAPMPSASQHLGGWLAASRMTESVMPADLLKVCGDLIDFGI